MHLPQFVLGFSALLLPTLKLESPGLVPLPLFVPCLIGFPRDLPPTLEALITCFDTYTMRRDDFHDDIAYSASQPDAAQQTAWTDAVAALLAVDGNCVSHGVSGLAGSYRVDLFRESVPGGGSFCVLSETRYNPLTGHFVKGWGHMVVPLARTAVSRNIHISAPHPLFDEGTPQQAAAIFKLTGAKSLLVAGRHRAARSTTFTCVGSTYFTTDPAHSTSQPFHLAMRAIFRWQNMHGRCLIARCAFIQMHGKSGDTCETDTTMLSAGLDHLEDSWYGDDSPVRRIKMNLDDIFPDWTNSLPPDSPLCPKTGTDNIFGRLLNGIPLTDLCVSSRPDASRVLGIFVHAEQSPFARNADHYEGWAKAVNLAMATTCAVGMVMDPITLLCVIPTSLLSGN